MTTRNLKNLDMAQRQLVHTIFYLDVQHLPVGFKYQAIIYDNFRKMKPTTGFARAFGDFNRRHFTLNLDQLFMYYTPKAQYKLDEITYLPLEELYEIIDRPHYPISNEPAEWKDSYGFTMYFTDRYITLIAQNQDVIEKWLDHLEMIRFRKNGRSVLTRQRSYYRQPQIVQLFQQVQPLQDNPLLQSTPQTPSITNGNPNTIPNQTQPILQSAPQPSQRPMSGARRNSQPQMESQKEQPSGEIPQKVQQNHAIISRPGSAIKTRSDQKNPPQQEQEIKASKRIEQMQQMRSFQQSEVIQRNETESPKKSVKQQANPQALVEPEKQQQIMKEIIHNEQLTKKPVESKKEPVPPPQPQKVQKEESIDSSPQKPPYLRPSSGKPKQVPTRADFFTDAQAQQQEVKLIGETRELRGRTMSIKAPEPVIMPVRLDSGRQTLRKTSQAPPVKVELESPEKIKTTGRSNSRNIWQDHDNDGNVIIKPAIMTANFTGQQQRKASQQQIQQRQQQPKAPQHTEEDDAFNEAEFMSQLLGIKKVEPQASRAQPQRPPSPPPEESQVKLQGFFLHSNLKTEEENNEGEQVTIPNFFIDVPQPKPLVSKYDDWDDDM